MSDINIEDVRFSSSAIDDFFGPPARTKRVASTAQSRKIRVATVQDISGLGFRRVAGDTLVHLSQQDFWRLGEDEDGPFIERLVSDDDGPIKG